MLIDCDTCQVRGDACADCVVSVMLGMPGMPGMPGDVDADEVRAIAVLAETGLVPPLRLVTPSAPDPGAAAQTTRSREPKRRAM
jgi:hypothetical protein